MQAFSSCSEPRLFFVVVHRFLIVVASLVVEHGTPGRMGSVAVHTCSTECGIFPDQGSNFHVPCIARQILIRWTTREACGWLLMHRKGQIRWDGTSKIGIQKGCGFYFGRPSGSLSLIPSCYVVRTLRKHSQVLRLPCNCRNKLRKESSKAYKSHESGHGNRCSSLSWTSRWLQSLTNILISASWESRGPILSNQIPDLSTADLLALGIQSSYN